MGKEKWGKRSEEKEVRKKKADGPASDDGTQQLYTAGSTFTAEG